MWYDYNKSEPNQKRKYQCLKCKKDLEYGKGFCYECQIEYPEEFAYHKEKLKSKQKYHKGEPIKTFEEIANLDFLYWNNKIYHKGWICSWQFMRVYSLWKNKQLYYAVIKDDYIYFCGRTVKEEIIDETLTHIGIALFDECGNQREDADILNEISLMREKLSPEQRMYCGQVLFGIGNEL